MTDAQLEEYAELVLFGLGDVREKNILIRLEHPAIDLARKLADLCYRRGADLVKYDFRDNYLQRARILHGTEKALTTLSPWMDDELEHILDGSWMIINLRGSEDDHILQTLPPERSKEYSRAVALKSAGLQRKTLTFQIPWIIVMVPSTEKAIDAFPELSGSDALAKYEQGIVDVLRLGDGAVDYWKESFESLSRRRDRFNGLGLKGLHFVDKKNGTDLKMDLIPGGRWATAEEKLPGGAPVRVNIPSCEIYTSPHLGRVNGRVHITKPFIPVRIPGDVIEGAWFEFSNGKVVDCGADTGDEAVRALIELDPQASYLGEVALVDRNSPVAAQNFLFHNILYDENAASHIAVGAGFPSLVAGMAEAGTEKLIAAGVNQSMQHQDMMIGSDSMDVDGIDGKGASVPIMRAGSFLED